MEHNVHFRPCGGEAKMRELVEKWRKFVRDKEDNGEWAGTVDRCADELEAALARRDREEAK